MKKLKITISYILGGVVLLGVVALAGSLTPPEGSSTDTGTMYSISDIYNKLTTGTGAIEGNHQTSTTSSPTGTMHTLLDIWNAIPTIQANTVATGTTIMGVTGTLQSPSFVQLSDTFGPMGYEAISFCETNYTRLPTLAELQFAMANSLFPGGTGLPGGFVEDRVYMSRNEVHTAALYGASVTVLDSMEGTGLGVNVNTIYYEEGDDETAYVRCVI